MNAQALPSSRLKRGTTIALPSGGKGAPGSAAHAPSIAAAGGRPGSLAEAALAIRSGALWVTANLDPTLPTERGLVPAEAAALRQLMQAQA